MARPGAKPGDWKATPLPADSAALPIPQRHFSAAEMARIRDGLVPEEMEDKWFIVWDDDRLRFHRSWTGLCVYEARFAPDDDGATLVEARVSREHGRYGHAADDDNARLMMWLIEALLLRRSVPLPV